MIDIKYFLLERTGSVNSEGVCKSVGHYNRNMDSVRFGRVLGIGTRLAAKTAKAALDAATAPNPSASQGEGARSPVADSNVGLGDRVTRTAAQVQQTKRGLKQGGKQFNKAVGGRLVRLSGALWLELTGVFFGIFAVSAIAGSWRMRAALRETAENHDAHTRFVISLVMAAVFGYFCVSSFVKANRRTRGD